MSEFSTHLDRRSLLATGAAVGAISILSTQVGAAVGAAMEGSAIRPFRVHVPDADLADLRQRIVATRWPERETVSDQSQGLQLATIQPLVRY